MINLKSTSPKYNPRIPAKSQRPTCEHSECRLPKVVASTHTDGTPVYSRWCRSHFNQRYYNGKSAVRVTAEKLGLRPSEYVERAAMIRGYFSNADYQKFLKNNPVSKKTTLDETAFRLQQIRSRIKL